MGGLLRLIFILKSLSFFPCTGKQQALEIRVGDVEPTNTGNILKNSLCKYVDSPLRAGPLNNVVCDSPLHGRYITVQRMDNSTEAVLGICEVTPHLSPSGELLVGELLPAIAATAGVFLAWFTSTNS
jgi:hypothetical protein